MPLLVCEERAVLQIKSSAKSGPHLRWVWGSSRAGGSLTSCQVTVHFSPDALGSARPCSEHFTSVSLLKPHASPYEVDAIITPILWMRKLNAERISDLSTVSHPAGRQSSNIPCGREPIKWDGTPEPQSPICWRERERHEALSGDSLVWSIYPQSRVIRPVGEDGILEFQRLLQAQLPLPRNGGGREAGTRNFFFLNHFIEV